MSAQHNKPTVRWAAWHASEKVEGLRTARIAVLFLGFSILYVLGVSLLLGYLPGLMFLGLCMALEMFWPRSLRPLGKHSERLAETLAWPLPPGTFPVRVDYLMEIDPLRSDDAVAAFVDGWLVVEGVQTSFSLRPRDAQILYSGEQGAELLLGGGQRVVIRPYDALTVAGETQASLRNRFEIALGRWLDERRPTLEGLVVLPPRPLRVMRSSERTLALLYSGIFMIGSSVALLSNGIRPYAGDLFAALILGLGIGATICGAKRVPRYARYRRSLPMTLRESSWGPRQR